MRHHITPRGAVLVIVAACLALAPAPGAAQGTPQAEPSLGYLVRVRADNAPIYAQADTRSPVVARSQPGDVLVVIGKEDAWFKVRLLRERRIGPSGPDSGYIQAAAVAVAGPGASPGIAARPGGGTGQSPKAPAGAAARWQPRLYGVLAAQSFTAKSSFSGIFGSSTGVFFGGGLDLSVGRNLLVMLGVTYFQKTGQRAFAYNGQVFQLGIADRISITPFDLDVVYRFRNVKHVVPYIGAGIGAVLYRETSDNSGAGDDVSTTGTGFQVLGGVEWPVARRLSIAVEGQYQGVRGVLGTTGISQSLNEHDLGGISARVRLIFGM
jgi:opacity protein-like surface antigen